MRQSIFEEIADISPTFIFLWGVLIVVAGFFVKDSLVSTLLLLGGFFLVFFTIIDNNLWRSCP